MSGLEFAIVFVILFGPGMVCMYIADAKGRNAYLWFVLGVVFSLFSIIAIAAVPPLKKGTPSDECPME